MLSSKHLFSGNTKSEILASVIRGEPDLAGIPANWVPLLNRCLTKDVRRRLQAIGEVRIALEDGPVAKADHQERRMPWAAIALAAVAVLLAAVLWTILSRKPILDNPLTDATFTPLIDYEGNETDASISPDGKFVAFMSDRGGVSHVWVDRVGAGAPIDLTPGKEDQRGPLRSVGFSHDGAEIWLAGTETRRLQMLPLLGGKPRLFQRWRIIPSSRVIPSTLPITTARTGIKSFATFPTITTITLPGARVIGSILCTALRLRLKQTYGGFQRLGGNPNA
jgi:hypothetical protein